MNGYPWRFLGVLLLAFVLASCDSSPVSDDPGFDQTELLNNVGANIILPAYTALQEDVDALELAASTFAADPSLATLEGLQNQLYETRRTWQDVNLFAFGPAGMQALRPSLNTYPTDIDQIRQNMTAGTYTLGTVTNRDAAGFPTLDYLLHGVAETPEGILATYTSDPDASARLDYLEANVGFIQDMVAPTVEEWTQGADPYIDRFTSEARAGTDVGSSLGMLINALVLHQERFLRDAKIGIPAGVRSAGVVRPALTEAYYSGYSRELAVANMRAVKRLFVGESVTGINGVGLDDQLVALGASSLSEQIIAACDEAIAALEALNDPLAAQIVQDNGPVLTAFQEMQDVVVLMKADMTSILGVTITFQDNDGD